MIVIIILIIVTEQTNRYLLLLQTTNSLTGYFSSFVTICCYISLTCVMKKLQFLTVLVKQFSVE